jgi:hypothetical protein
MSATAHFASDLIEVFARAKILGVRAGPTHRFTGVWVVVVDRRVFVRSWGDKPTGWYRAFQREPEGAVTLEKREVPVRARAVRSERMRKAVSMAYADKYPTPGSKKWVTGFAELAREANTLELVPR